MNQAELAVGHEAPAAPEPSEAQLLDVLYEVLAQGVPLKGSLRTQDVERFLHEHARSKKSIPEMLEFFNQHTLPTSAAEYGADPELGELASGLHKDRDTLSTFAPVEAEDTARRARESGPMLKLAAAAGAELPAVEGRAFARDPGIEARSSLREPNLDPRAAGVDHEDTARRRRPVEIVVAASSARPSGLLQKLGFVLSGLLALALVLTIMHAQSLSSELNHARLQQRSTDAALSALEARAEALQSSLNGSENERRALSDRFDSFVVGEAQKRSAEEVALERILGPRFEALRDKALQEAFLAAP